MIYLDIRYASRSDSREFDGRRLKESSNVLRQARARAADVQELYALRLYANAFTKCKVFAFDRRHSYMQLCDTFGHIA